MLLTLHTTGNTQGTYCSPINSNLEDFSVAELQQQKYKVIINSIRNTKKNKKKQKHVAYALL